MRSVLELVMLEPWRIGQGQHVDALDPTWSSEPVALCDGEIDWEGTSRWWWCKKCGFCGCWTKTEHHPIVSPQNFFDETIKNFIECRVSEGMSRDDAMNQALHVAGVALRYAATVPRDQIGDYVRERLIKR